jgi:hypothetical protein
MLNCEGGIAQLGEQQTEVNIAIPSVFHSEGPAFDPRYPQCPRVDQNFFIEFEESTYSMSEMFRREERVRRVCTRIQTFIEGK